VSVFEGTYEDFLSRVGWKSEVAEAVPSEGGNERCKGLDRREARRLRAELVNERSKALGTLQTRIQEAEESIITLEKGIERDTEELVKASEKGDWQSIQRLSRDIHDAKEEIERLFGELEVLTEKHSGRTKEFEERLAGLGQL
jgi:ATP-binding cassette, subfamily F, member 3